MESNVENLIFMERSEPKRRLLRSDGALYLACLIAVVGVIVLGYDLSQRFQWPRMWVQLVLYLVLIGIGYALYRFRLTAYRYTLTTRRFSVDRLVGSKEKTEAQVHLKDIAAVRPYPELDGVETGRVSAVHLGRREQTTAVVVKTQRGRRTLLVALSQAHRKELIEAWKNAR